MIFSATIGAFGLGTGFGWSSPVLPNIIGCNTEEIFISSVRYNCTLPVSFEEYHGHWIASIFNIGCLIGALGAGSLLNRIGRKWTMILSNVPFALGWICLLLPALLEMTNPALFYVGRILTGIGKLNNHILHDLLCT